MRTAAAMSLGGTAAAAPPAPNSPVAKGTPGSGGTMEGCAAPPPAPAPVSFVSTRTVAPSCASWSPISSRESGSSRWWRMARRTGRAPYAGSYPASASRSRASGERRRRTPRAERRSRSCCTSTAQMAAMRSRVSRSKRTISSSRLTNSGGKASAIALSTSGRALEEAAPSGSDASASAPKLDVMMMIVLRKSTVLPCESVRRPSSRTCSSSVATSRCAFSNSSRSSTEYGRRRTASVSWPPSSYPT
mmetsp:Transcript_37048/g.116474  ORF Transcript_37048/g.116474 Transcript_37048/m.116474 type:complete len:247 (-) Transcript_37048:693-1433(-)